MSASDNSVDGPSKNIDDKNNEYMASEDVKSRLNHETSKISWLELQKFYASGAVIAVKPGLDLLQVGEAFQSDSKADVERWLAEGVVYKVNEQQAQLWYDQQTVLWSVVLAPWVLVQEVVENT